MKFEKKISLIITSLSGGGAERVSVNIANGLVQFGWDVDLIILNLKNSTYLDQISSKVNLIKLNVSKVRYTWFPLVKYIKTKKPKLFLVFNYELTITLVLLKYFVGSKFKIVSRNINTLSKKQKQLASQKKLKKYLLIFLLNNFYTKADHIINQCIEMRNDLLNYFPEIENRSSVIYNPIDSKILNFLNSNNLLGIKKRDYLLCVGRLEKQKAFHHAIKVFANIAEVFPNLRLKILGSGTLENDLKNMTYNLGIKDRVDFEGFKKNIIPYYIYAKATLITSQYEGFPNTLIESVSLGTPVISFDCPSGPSETIVDGINGYLVKNNDLEDFKKKLLLALENKFHIDNMNSTIHRHKLHNVLKNYDELLVSML